MSEGGPLHLVCLCASRCPGKMSSVPMEITATAGERALGWWGPNALTHPEQHRVLATL